MSMPQDTTKAGGRIPSIGLRHWTAMIAMAVMLWAALAPGRPSAFGMLPQAADDPAPQFIKAGKTYVNIRMVTHVVEDPGMNLPQGALQVYFASASPVSNVIYLFGDDAEAVRAVLDGQSAGTAPAARPAARPGVRRPPAARKPASNALPPSNDPG